MTEGYSHTKNPIAQGDCCLHLHTMASHGELYCFLYNNASRSQSFCLETRASEESIIVGLFAALCFETQDNGNFILQRHKRITCVEPMTMSQGLYRGGLLFRSLFLSSFKNISFVLLLVFVCSLFEPLSSNKTKHRVSLYLIMPLFCSRLLCSRVFMSVEALFASSIHYILLSCLHSCCKITLQILTSQVNAEGM